MKFLAIAILSVAFLAPVSALAVDNSISAYCGAEYAGTSYQRPGGFCSAVAGNKTMVVQASQWCPPGEVRENGECVCVKA